MAARPLPPGLRNVPEVLVPALAGTAPWFLVMFALRFPEDRASGGRWLQVALLGAALSCGMLNGEGNWSGTNATVQEASALIGTWLTVVSLALVAAILTVRLRQTSGVTRVQLRWVLVGVSVPLLLQAWDAIANVTRSDALGYAETVPPLGKLAFYGSIAYVLTRSHYINPQFVLNRAAGFSLTGAILLFGVSVVDWLTSRYLEHSPYGQVINALAAIGLGVLWHTLYRRVEPVVERTIFKAKYRAEQRLRTIGEALSYATTSASIEDALIREASRELRLVSASLFRKSSDSEEYLRVASVGWPENGECIKADDRLVRILRLERRSVDLHEWPIEGDCFPDGLGAARVAIPIRDSDELLGIAIYSAHRDHTDLDQSEIDLLCALADRSAAAYSRIEVRSLRALAFGSSTTSPALP
jgi:F0F1-type ATP synthase assembly protein I